MNRAPYLDIWGGWHGYRVVMVDGERFEMLGTFRTWGEAGNAKRAAERLSAGLPATGRDPHEMDRRRPA